MPEFLRLTTKEQTEILAAMSSRTGISAQILQKDVWVCWALRELFSLKANIRKAFKGGTSLSKAYQAIHRFSEDVDVTFDYRDLCRQEATDPFSMTKSQQKRLTDDLKAAVRHHVHQAVGPAIQKSFLEITSNIGRFEVSEDGEKIWLYYPSGAGTNSPYVEDSVLIEFGGRNVTEPSDSLCITATLAQHLPMLEFPKADVVVLSPARTFWEKATLIHVACQRSTGSDPNRISRHWYDLTMLHEMQIGRDALANRRLLEDVVKHKKVFFHASYANYDDCLTGKFCIIPEEPLLSGLKRDYQQMIAAGMFDQDPPTFEELIAQLELIQKAINR